MEARLCCLIICVITGLTLTDAKVKWSYTGHTGVSYWDKLFPEACSGKHQSPIDIRPEETTFDPNLKDFAIWYDPPKPDSKMYIKNNGHTVQVDLQGDFFVTNGGLSHVYKGLQFHYHWGSDVNENHGSEHLIDGQAFPLEMHLVTYNSELYSTIGEAIKSPGGLAVLGTMFEISTEDNPVMTTIVTALKEVLDPDLHDEVELPLMSLRDFLPADISRYYRYNGSLTTPGCFESVIWTVFDDKQTISLHQLRQFKRLLQHKHVVQKGKMHDHHEVSRHRRSLSSKQRVHLAIIDVLDELGIRGDNFQEAIFHFELQQLKIKAKHHHHHHHHHHGHGGGAIVDRQKREVSEGEVNDNETSKEAESERHHEEEVVINDQNNDNGTTVGVNHEEKHTESYTFVENVEEPMIEDPKFEDPKSEDPKSEDPKSEDPKSEDTGAEVTEIVETDIEEVIYNQDTMVDNFRPVQPLNDRVVYRSFSLIERNMNILGEIKTGQLNDGGSADDIDDVDNEATYHKLSLPAILTVLIVTVTFM